MPAPARLPTGLLALALALLIASSLPAGGAAQREPIPAAPSVGTDARLRAAVDGVDEARLRRTVEALAGFGTRHLYSPADRSGRGIAAAAAWIAAEMRTASPRLQVTLDTHKLEAQGGRLSRAVDLVNVVGLLPGSATESARRVLVSGHYDSVARGPDGEFHWDDGSGDAPGANDDASGTAVMLEMARLFGPLSPEASLVFVGFAGEEQGLVGSTLHASRAAAAAEPIIAVLNNDIVGNEEGGSGRDNGTSVHLYSAGPEDSPSRELARHVEMMAELLVPLMDVRMVFRHDRFGRGGDHTPFDQRGYAAVRFTVAEEDYRRQHDIRDTADGISWRYLARVARVNAAALASLAWAPPAPRVTDESGQPLLDRGPGGYDARLRWTMAAPPADLAGFEIVQRDTTAPRWEKVWFVPATEREHLLEGVRIDTVTLGVRSVDREGFRSLASVYTYPVRTRPEYRLRP